MLKNKKPSTYLIILSSIIIFLGLIMSFLVFDNVSRLEYNAKLINETGIIRGSIQRATKLMLYGEIEKASKIIEKINKKLKIIICNARESNEFTSVITKNFISLQKKWFLLKNLLLEYKQTKDKKLIKKIVNLSEDCWYTADAVVLNTQIITQNRIGGIRIFYVILGLNILTAVFVIILVYLYIKKRLEYESSHDILTDLYNRRFFEKLFEQKFEQAKRYNRSLSLILFDIDHFKKINDTFGHKMGDKVLTKLANIVKNSIRKSDIVCRVGGEEFAIICPETNKDEAFKIAEKIRIIIENTNFEKIEKVTISLGIAELKEKQSKEELYRNADIAMYHSKRKGRNKSTIFSKKLLTELNR